MIFNVILREPGTHAVNYYWSSFYGLAVLNLILAVLSGKQIWNPVVLSCARFSRYISMGNINSFYNKT